MAKQFRPLRDAFEPVETRVISDQIQRWFVEYKLKSGTWENVKELLPSFAIVSVCYSSEREAKRAAKWVKTNVTTKDDSPRHIFIATHDGFIGF
jgi:hypothetical protein